MSKTYELKFTMTIKDDTNEEFQELKNDILSGQLQREMFNNSEKNKLGLIELTATLTEKK
jgi:ketol-acid reductoisomerase